MPDMAAMECREIQLAEQEQARGSIYRHKSVWD
jgi:hypothetical protein